MPLFALLNTQTLIIVLVVALVVFGPHKLPEIGRQLGNAMRELRKMSGDMQRALDLDGHSSSSYDYYNSSNYDSASSYNYTPPSDTPLDQYGLDDGHAPALEAGPSAESEAGESASANPEGEQVAEKPKRSRRKRTDAETAAEIASESEGDAAEPVSDSKPRRSRRRVAATDSEAEGSDVVVAETPKPRSRRGGAAKVSAVSTTVVDSMAVDNADASTVAHSEGGVEIAPVETASPDSNQESATSTDA